jgi:hypothetical protein
VIVIVIVIVDVDVDVDVIRWFDHDPGHDHV